MAKICPLSFARLVSPASNALFDTSIAAPSYPFSSCSPPPMTSSVPFSARLKNPPVNAVTPRCKNPAGQLRPPDIDIPRNRRRRDRLSRIEEPKCQIDPLVPEIPPLLRDIKRCRRQRMQQPQPHRVIRPGRSDHRQECKTDQQKPRKHAQTCHMTMPRMQGRTRQRTT